MSLLRNIIRWDNLLGIKSNQSRLHFLLRQSPRHFSTNETEKDQQQQNQVPDSTIETFLHPPQGLVYGQLSGLGRFMMKTDVINMLEGCNLTPKDIKVQYNWYFAPTGMVVQFSSRSAFDNAVRVLGRKGRLYKLDKVDRSLWEIESYDGKAVIMQGIPRYALPEDVERFLCGCQFCPNTMQFMLRLGVSDTIKLGVIRFPSQVDAMHAVLVKNRNFCLNNQIKIPDEDTVKFSLTSEPTTASNVKSIFWIQTTGSVANEASVELEVDIVYQMPIFLPRSNVMAVNFIIIKRSYRSKRDDSISFQGS